MTPDFSPIIGTVPDVPGFILDVGWGTYGFKAGPVAGTRVAELIATGHDARAYLAPFAIERFATGRSSARRRRRRCRTRTAAGKREEGAHGRGGMATRRPIQRVDRASGSRDDGVDLHACPVGRHPRHAALQGRARPARSTSSSAGSAGFAGAATVGMGQGPHDHDLIGMPDLATYTLVPVGDRASPAFACDIEVDGEPWPYCSRTALSAPIERLAGLGYSMKVGVEAEHMLVTRAAGRLDRAVRPDRLRHAREALLRLQGPRRRTCDYLRDARRAMEGLGWEPYASDHEDATAQFEINWKYADALDDGRPLHVLQDDDQPGRRAVRRDRDAHAQAVQRT